MKRFVIAACAAAIPFFARADDAIKWGQSANGLRLGIQCKVQTATSDQSFTVTISAQNVSQRPLTIPAPDTFIHANNRASDDFNATPLMPVIDMTRTAPRSEGWESAWSTSQNGIAVNEAPKNVASWHPVRS